MLRLVSLILLLCISGFSYASTYDCNNSLTQVPSILWNGSYWIQVRPTFNGRAVAQVRLVRQLPSGLPSVEMIRLECQFGSAGAEYDCAERDLGLARPELLAAQFFPNGWAQLYASPRGIWQPFMLGQLSCNRRF